MYRRFGRSPQKYFEVMAANYAIIGGPEDKHAHGRQPDVQGCNPQKQGNTLSCLRLAR